MRWKANNTSDQLQRLLVFFIAVIAIGVVSYGGLKAFQKLKSSSSKGASDVSETLQGLGENSSEELNRVPDAVIEDRSELLRRARQTMDAMLSARKIDEIVPLIENGEELRGRITKYCRSRPWIGGRIVSSEIQESGRKALRALVKSPSGGIQELSISLDSGLIDWGTFSGENIGSEAEVLQRSLSDEGVVARLIIEFGPNLNYHNFRFGDEKLWVAYRISHPDFEEFYWVYAKKGGMVEERLRRMLVGDSGKVAMILRLKASGAEELSRRQLELIDVISYTWSLPDGRAIENYQADDL
mgnify:CR=1 FL=1